MAVLPIREGVTVAETWALIVAVEKFLDADHRGLAYTDAATRALSECLSSPASPRRSR